MSEFIDEIITKLINSKPDLNDRRILRKTEIRILCQATLTIIKSQPIFLELKSPITICGDIHGQLFDLLRIFEKNGSPETTNYLFLGDYVDRGDNSINTISLLFAYKIKYPKNFFLLRGNHESALINKQYGFYEECKILYNLKVWNAFNAVFEYLPISAIINYRILCIHGGISPDLKEIEDLKNIKRPSEIPENGLLSDLLWSDPEKNCEEWCPSERGTSFVFGLLPLNNILKKLNIELIVRAHQAINNGYDFPFYEKKIVTIFSASDYGGYGNKSAIMNISSNNVCSFITFESLNQNNSTLERPFSPPIQSNY